MSASIAVTQILPNELHQYWPFLARGVDDIIKKIHADFIREDVYTSIRVGGSLAYIVTRGDRRLGWFNIYTSERPYSHVRDLFLWCVWSLPPRERLPDDDIPEAMAIAFAFIRKKKLELGCAKIVTVSPRNYSRFGFQRMMSTWESD